jgi:hypothetical protein
VLTVAAGIKAFVSGEKFAGLVQKGAGLVRAAESNPAALARFEETSAEATRETLKDCYAAARALVALSLGREPSDPEVDAFFAEIADHPNASFRFHRLLGEARKSASRRRRRFLASVFYGLEFSAMPDDERDRVDLVAERMVPADVSLLMRINELEQTATPGDQVEVLTFSRGPGSRLSSTAPTYESRRPMTSAIPRAIATTGSSPTSLSRSASMSTRPPSAHWSRSDAWRPRRAKARNCRGSSTGF